MDNVHCKNPKTLDEKSRILLDTWEKRCLDAMNSENDGVMRIIEDGAIPFECAPHGWFGVFPCHVSGVQKHIPLSQVLEILSQKSFPKDWSDSVDYFLLRKPRSYEECEHNTCSSNERFRLDVSEKYEYMHINLIGPSCMSMTLDGLRVAVEIVFLMTHWVRYLVAGKLSIPESFVTQLLPHLLTEYNDVHWVNTCPNRSGRQEARALCIAKTDSAN
eukprot:6182423-Pleurochrysis_carterae.AAC.1